MITYLLPHFIYKVQTVRLTGGFLESEGVIYLFYILYQGVSKVEEIICI